MCISKKTHEEIKKDFKEAANSFAENWLKNNPPTEPLDEYLKKVFITAYKFGIEIINI